MEIGAFKSDPRAEIELTIRRFGKKLCATSSLPIYFMQRAALTIANSAREFMPAKLGSAKKEWKA